MHAYDRKRRVILEFSENGLDVDFCPVNWNTKIVVKSVFIEVPFTFFDYLIYFMAILYMLEQTLCDRKLRLIFEVFSKPLGWQLLPLDISTYILCAILQCLCDQAQESRVGQFAHPTTPLKHLYRLSVPKLYCTNRQKST